MANIVNIFGLMYEKRVFLVMVFLNLLIQLGITYYVMNKTNNPNINTIPLFIAQLIIIFVFIFVPMPKVLKFALFGLFSYVFGVMLSVYKKKYSLTAIDTAIQGAMSVFGIMLVTGIALVAGGINLGYKFGAFLFWSLLLLIVFRLVFVLGQHMSQANKYLSFFGIILFALYVVYDTNKILQRKYYGDFLLASMDYYLDIINLFSNILNFNSNN